MNKYEAKRRITKILQQHLPGANPQAYKTLVPKSLTSGKLYEAFVLGLVARDLVQREHLSLRLVNSSYIALKSAPGPINPAYPHIEVYRAGSHVADLWTDVEFSCLSCKVRGNPQPPGRGDYHELDLVVVDAHTQGRPATDSIWLGVECKNTGYGKGLLKEILGVRRELSLLSAPARTRFVSWPRTSVPATPPSCLLVYSTDPDVHHYAAPGQVFGIDFTYEPLNP